MLRPIVNEILCKALVEDEQATWLREKDIYASGLLLAHFSIIALGCGRYCVCGACLPTYLPSTLCLATCLDPFCCSRQVLRVRQSSPSVGSQAATSPKCFAFRPAKFGNLFLRSSKLLPSDTVSERIRAERTYGGINSCKFYSFFFPTCFSTLAAVQLKDKARHTELTRPGVGDLWWRVDNSVYAVLLVLDHSECMTCFVLLGGRVTC
jgi:hypothetical protein